MALYRAIRTKPISLGLTNFQQAKPEKEANLPLSPSPEAWLTCQATTLEGKRPAWESLKPTLGQKVLSQTTVLEGRTFRAFKCPLFIEGWPTPSGVAQIGLRPGQDLPETVSFTGWSSANSNLRFRRFSPSSRIWIGGLPGCWCPRRGTGYREMSP